MSNERDQGFAALQRGDYAGAASLLEAACREDPNDFHSHLYLGGAYHQLKRPQDAVRLLTRAVELQPANPQARYNLGIALAQADRHTDAVASLQQALALKPDYAVAQQELQRLLHLSQATNPSPPAYGAATQQFPAAPQAGGYGARPLNANDAGSQPTVQGSAPLYGGMPSAAPGSYSQPGAQGMAPLYGGPPQGGYGQSPTTPGVGGYSARGGFTSQARSPQVSGYAPNFGYQDGFSIGDAFNDLLQILTSPRMFFESQAGCEGLLAPMSMGLVYLLCIGIGVIAMFFTIGSKMGMAGMVGLFAVPFGLAFGYLFMLLGYLIVAGVVHVIGLLFGNRSPYSGSFRAVVYSYAPSSLIGALALLLLAPMMSGSTPGAVPAEAAILIGVLNTIGMIWSAVLLVMAIRSIQRLSLGAAVGVVLLCGALLFAVRLGMSAMTGR